MNANNPVQRAPDGPNGCHQAIVLTVALALFLVVPAFAGPRKKAPAKPAVKPRITTKVDARAIASGIQSFYDKAPGFHADFTQVVRKRGLKKGITGKGKVWLKKGGTRTVPAADGKGGTEQIIDQGKMRWDYPTWEKYYFSDGRVLWSYERRERLAVKMPVEGSELYQATRYLIGQGDLTSDFDLALVDSPVPDSWALQLTPKKGTRLMRSLTLVVDKRTFAVKASVMVDPLGDSTTLHFTAPSYDAIDDKTFEWSPPPGVTVKSL